MHSYPDFTDNELIDLLRQGDESAFTEIYNRYWKKLFTIASNRVDSLEDAEEIVQDIFISLWNRKTDLQIRLELSSYLAVSVKYRVFQTLNRYFQKRKYRDYILTKEQFDNSTQQLLDFKELQDELAKYVQRLPEKCQLVFRLSREEGCTQKQIAEKLNLSEKTVEAHLGKAFRILRIKLSSFLTTLL
ncbi:RNA polymerase sigma-70 factor [Sphingobacterium sp. DN00404]|uniref:RNA polymerase sigma-70 factor n=1 Tax=Sphingobacterium micropteri TaxID=2763501 RepID=A0ABR7YJQ5_9SPHI|nr:RNA polymerase sigma-70 factor [Sphingobacterium micropteri]MBD1431547.1 RNA polymerase sigma-70 factor [Sphingobacterium micropteri]